MNPKELVYKVQKEVAPGPARARYHTVIVVLALLYRVAVALAVVLPGVRCQQMPATSNSTPIFFDFCLSGTVRPYGIRKVKKEKKGEQIKRRRRGPGGAAAVCVCGACTRACATYPPGRPSRRDIGSRVLRAAGKPSGNTNLKNKQIHVGFHANPSWSQQ